MTVLVAEFSVHPTSFPLESVHGIEVVELMVRNYDGKVIVIWELRGTAEGEAMNAKLTGSYCRFKTNV